MSFTPGPWDAVDVRYQQRGQIRIWARGGGHIANVRPAVTNCEANARLIAASPEIYTALVDISEIAANYDSVAWHHVARIAQAAKAKADGK